MSKYESKLESFISSNAELVGEYESLECSAPIEYCDTDIIDYVQRILKVDKTAEFNRVLAEALRSSIRYNVSILDSLETMMNDATCETKSFNSTQQYFKEINDIYNKHNNDYNIEYCPENREKLIEMNLKTVISIAKKYQGLGLTLEELISAGNLGLVIAWDKFDPNRSKLKDQVLEAIEPLPEEFSYEKLIEAVHTYMDYGDVKKKFTDLQEEQSACKRGNIRRRDPRRRAVAKRHPKGKPLPLHTSAKRAVCAADCVVCLQEQARSNRVRSARHKRRSRFEARERVLFYRERMNFRRNSIRRFLPFFRIRIICRKVRFPERNMAHSANTVYQNQLRALFFECGNLFRIRRQIFFRCKVSLIFRYGQLAKRIEKRLFHCVLECAGVIGCERVPFAIRPFVHIKRVHVFTGNLPFL